jgi:hypothetical protein
MAAHCHDSQTCLSVWSTPILLKLTVKHMEQAGTKLKIHTPIGTHPLIQGFRRAQIHADRTCSMVFPCYYKAQFP